MHFFPILSQHRSMTTCESSTTVTLKPKECTFTVKYAFTKLLNIIIYSKVMTFYKDSLVKVIKKNTKINISFFFKQNDRHKEK